MRVREGEIHKRDTQGKPGQGQTAKCENRESLSFSKDPHGRRRPDFGFLGMRGTGSAAEGISRHPETRKGDVSGLPA